MYRTWCRALFFILLTSSNVAAQEVLGTWQGPYVGTTVGVSRPRAFSSTDLPGHLPGLLVGYQFQTGPWIFGVEANWFEAAKSTVNIPQSISLRLSGRFGWATESALHYVSAGLASTRGHSLDSGFSASIGSEFKFNDQLSLRVEGGYSQARATVLEVYGLGLPVLTREVETKIEEFDLRAAIILHPFSGQSKASQSSTEQSFSWNGFYIGGTFAGGSLDAPAYFYNPRTDPLVQRTCHTNTQAHSVDRGVAAISGLHAGYQRRFGSWVLGVEVDGDYRTSAQGSFTARGRVGYVRGRSMLYATAGFRRAHWALEDDLDGLRLSNWHNGIIGGVGVETQLGPRVSFRMEASAYSQRPERYGFGGPSVVSGKVVLFQPLERSVSVASGFHGAILKAGVSLKLD